MIDKLNLLKNKLTPDNELDYFLRRDFKQKVLKSAVGLIFTLFRISENDSWNLTSMLKYDPGSKKLAFNIKKSRYFWFSTNSNSKDAKFFKTFLLFEKRQKQEPNGVKLRKSPKWYVKIKLLPLGFEKNSEVIQGHQMSKPQIWITS